MTSEQLPTVPPSERVGVPGHDRATERASAIRLLTLRTQGMTYEQIAEAEGYSDRSSVRQALLRALDRHEAENVADLRAVENLRLDATERMLRGIAADPKTKVGEKIRAADALTRLSARRSRMNGYDAPVALQIGAGVTAELHDALAELRDVVLGEVLDSTEEPVHDASGG